MKDWLDLRVAYLKALNKPTKPQLALISLAEQETRTITEEGMLKTLVRAEKAADRKLVAEAKAIAGLTKNETAAQKARNHQMYRTAGLLGLAGFLDIKTGMPTIDRGELLGMLLTMQTAFKNKYEKDTELREKWKKKGDKALLGAENRTKPSKPIVSG